MPPKCLLTYKTVHTRQKIPIRLEIMAGASPIRQLLTRLRGTGAPLSFSLLTIEVGTFLLFFLTSGGAARSLFESLAFSPQTAISQPWTLVTYAFAWPLDAIWVALYVFLALYYFATALERALGTPALGWLLLCVTASAPLALWGGSAVLRIDVTLASAALPVSAVIVGWATRFPQAMVMLWFVIPVKGMWLGWFTAVLVVLGYGWGSPALGFFAAVPLAVAHFWVRRDAPLPKFGQRGAKDEPLSAWERRRREEAERLRLKELFERSYRENDEDGGEK
jgi:hypothetical protein